MEVNEPTPEEDRVHPMHRFAAECLTKLDEVQSVVGLSTLAADECAELFVELTRVI